MRANVIWSISYIAEFIFMIELGVSVIKIY